MKLSSRRARLAAAAALALVIGVPASLGATGLAAKVVGLSDTTPTAAQYPSSKVTICHHTHSKTNPFVTITVSQNALPAHLGHGDTVGPCSQEQPPAAPVAAATSHKLKKAHKAKHDSAGKSSLHGKPAKAPKVKTHGKSGETHGQSGAPATGDTAVHGKSHNTTHGQGAAHQKSHGNGQSQTHGKSGQVHGNGQGHGQGQGNANGQEHGQGGTHGNGGGNGKGH